MPKATHARIQTHIHCTHTHTRADLPAIGGVPSSLSSSSRSSHLWRNSFTLGKPVLRKRGEDYFPPETVFLRFARELTCRLTSERLHHGFSANRFQRIKRGSRTIIFTEPPPLPAPSSPALLPIRAAKPRSTTCGNIERHRHFIEKHRQK